MKKLLLSIIKSIVDAPQAVKIEQLDENGLVILKLSVAEEDIGRIIGKEGKMINAIRSLLHVAARKQGIRVRVELKDVLPLKISPLKE